MEYKGYVITLSKHSPQHEIRHTGKGSLPNLLSGLFTSSGAAKAAVDKYVKSKQDK